MAPNASGASPATMEKAAGPRITKLQNTRLATNSTTPTTPLAATWQRQMLLMASFLLGLTDWLAGFLFLLTEDEACGHPYYCSV